MNEERAKTVIPMASKADIPLGSTILIGSGADAEEMFVWKATPTTLTVRRKLPRWWKPFGRVVRWYWRNTGGTPEPLMTEHPWTDGSLMPEWDRPTR